MRFKGLLIFILVVSHWAGRAQISTERVAQARMEKGKWAKAKFSLKKAIRKDSINPEAKLVYAQWYFVDSNPDFDIDSAYQYTLASMADYALEDQRQRDRLMRFPLDSLILIRLRERIDSAAFERAKVDNTEASYISFLNGFIYAKQHDMAVELRDEVSFLDALKQNTYQSFDQYLVKYPESHRAEEARVRYERLLFEEKTKDGKLKSYTSFHKNFPESPYRRVVEEQIFEIGTASGKLEDYLSFISNYKKTPQATKAKNIVYHISRQLNYEIPKQILSDSLLRVMKMEDGYWVPFLKNAKFGFMNEDGVEVLPATFQEIESEYLCGNISEDYIITSDGIVSRSGKLILSGGVQSIEDLGFGILFVQDAGCNHVLHKSGFKLIDACATDARIIANHFVAILRNKKWDLYSFTGRKITDANYDDIQSEEDIIIFTKRGKKSLNTIEQVAVAADKISLPDNMVFDEVRKLSSDKILVKNGSLEGVLNSDLQFEIELDRQILTLTSFGFTRKTLNKVSTVGLSKGLDKEEFNNIKPYLNWLGLYKQANAKLYHLPSSAMVEENLDSLWFINRLAMALKGDSLKVMFGSGRKMIFPASTKVTFVKSPDSIRYLYLQEKNKKQVYDVDSGTKRFAMELDHVEEIGYNLFLVEYKGKKGIMRLDGKLVLPIEYDAIVRSNNNIVSLLKERKFGLFNLENQKLVKALYERNLAFFSESVLVAYKDGFYGFIDEDAKPISDFEFDEVNPWSDSSALVKRNFRWMIYNIYDRKVAQNQIKDYSLLKDTPEEKIAIFHRENEYGVISNKRGVIIPATFSDVLNLGTPEKPFYFTEKNVEEAGIFVVIYYNGTGELIRRQVYEADEYDRIYCR